MTAGDIKRLVDWLPPEAVQDIGVDGYHSAALLPELPEQQKWLIVYRRLDFGWHFCRVLCEHDLPFPSWLNKSDRPLYNAWLWMQNPRRYSSPAVEQAVSLRQGGMSDSRALIEGLLMSGIAEPEKIVGGCMTPEALRMYALLFFCAADRRKDALFLQHVLYPKGRIPEMLEGYLESSSYRVLLMKLGFTKGADYVQYVAGLDAGDLADRMASGGSASRFEAMTVAHGLILSEIGLWNQSHNTSAMVAAGRLISAGKIGGVGASEENALGPVADALSTEVREIGKRDYERATKLTISRTFAKTDGT